MLSLGPLIVDCRRSQDRLSFFCIISCHLNWEYQYWHAFLLSSLLIFGIFKRHALIRIRTPIIWYLCIVLSTGLQNDTTFGFAKFSWPWDILENKSYKHTFMAWTRFPIVCWTPASLLRRSASVWINAGYLFPRGQWKALFIARVVFKNPYRIFISTPGCRNKDRQK